MVTYYRLKINCNAGALATIGAAGDNSMTTAQQLRSYRGPAIFKLGFRPFFLGGAVWAGAAMALFLPMLQGKIALPTAFSVLDWHIHELLYGYLPAIVAGFLLTAVPSWTGRPPVTGAPLAALFAIWLAGRAAVASSALTGPVFTAAVDLFFLIVLGAIVGREIVAGKNLRNLNVLALVALLGAGNLVFHVEAAVSGGADYGERIGIAAAVLLIALIGGRIVPSFTRNWLARSGPENLPALFGKFDLAAIAITAIALAIWVAAPQTVPAAAACALAGAVHLIRLARWKGYRTFSEPLVAILHAAYIFVPIGFLLTALAGVFPDAVPPPSGIHAWTVGAVGLMTLAVMTRASLGHTGQPLTASSFIVAIYASAGVAALVRIVAAFGVQPLIMLHIAALGWVLAFWGFSAVFAPLLLRSRT
jgi:uncharacterized protein involved in response to NO